MAVLRPLSGPMSQLLGSLPTLPRKPRSPPLCCCREARSWALRSSAAARSNLKAESLTVRPKPSRSRSPTSLSSSPAESSTATNRCLKRTCGRSPTPSPTAPAATGAPSRPQPIRRGASASQTFPPASTGSSPSRPATVTPSKSPTSLKISQSTLKNSKYSQRAPSTSPSSQLLLN